MANFPHAFTGQADADTVLAPCVVVRPHHVSARDLAAQGVEGVAYHADALNRLETVTDEHGTTTYTYDAVGNRTAVTQANGVETAYTYDSLNRLTQLTSRASDGTLLKQYDYTLDATGRGENGTFTNFVVDHNQQYAQVLAEVENGITVKQYTYGDDLLSQTEGVGEERFFLYDGLGTTRALTDVSGAVSDEYFYEAFGNLLASTGNSDNDYRYTGEQYDSELGQYYLRARYYDQSVGRFTQMDEWMGRSQEPVTLHKYGYANGNPVNGVDPSGFFTTSIDFAGASNIAAIQSTMSLARVAIKTLGPPILISGGALSVEATMEYNLGFPIVTARAQNEINIAAQKAAVTAAKSLNNVSERPVGHHSIPVYMCGAVEAARQQLVPLRPAVHTALHSALVTYSATINSAYKRHFKGANKIFSYSNKEPLQLLAGTPQGRAVIGRHLDLFYNFGWFELGAPYFRGIFEQERTKYIGGVTSLPTCQRP